ncbi:hypothetical protein EI74_0416 [Mycoplasma testudineum]|uniref:Uncharacterized protein n=1 Tax=Mycoplasma testudineum TaxID=244584 RepID=A0A4V3C311_9MOLU|nr:hypothetical protein CG473_01695 [Mycoplasma testudineum]TDO20339.1 hypothetical protein EI74_0416 [Mycoplasma testudineum]
MITIWSCNYVFYIKFLKYFKKTDENLKKELIRNNQNFNKILEDEISKVKNYVFPSDLNKFNIEKDRRIKFQSRYYFKKIKNATERIEKFVYIREAVWNNVNWSFTYKNPEMYSKYFEFKLYKEAGFI